MAAGALSCDKPQAATYVGFHRTGGEYPSLVYHDDDRDVTCWGLYTIHGVAISCMADRQWKGATP